MPHLSDDIWLEVKFTSTKRRLYTAELAGAGSAAGASFDFIIQGPGMTAPIHSQPVNGYVCCGSKRRYLSSKPLSGEPILVNLKRIERSANAGLPIPYPTELKPGTRVLYELGMDRTGKLAASSVRLAPAE